jgi:hypothetical protein
MFFEHSPFPTVGSSAAYRGSNFTSAERTKFPGRREKSREFLRFSRFLRKSVSKTSAKPASCERIPCADEQGIISREQGIYSAFGAGAGNLARNRFLCSATSNCGNMYPCLPSDTPHFPRVDRAEPTRSATSPRAFATLTPGSGGWARGGFPKFGGPWRRGALAPAARYGVVSPLATGTWRPT